MSIVRTILSLLPPLVTLAAIAPFFLVYLDDPSILPWFAFLPLYIGLLAAPGYLYAVRNPQPNSRALRVWIRASLLAAAVASLAGAAISLFTVFIAVLALWCFLASMALLAASLRPRR